MYIKRTTDMKDIIRLVPIEVKLREKEKSPIRAQELLDYVQSQLNNPLFYAVIVYEDETERVITGYMFLLAITIRIMGMKQVVVIRVWYDHKQDKKVMRDIGMDIIRTVASNHGIKKVKIEVQRGAKVYERIWGFKPVSTVLERRL
jgi:hypothetical protein